MRSVWSVLAATALIGACGYTVVGSAAPYGVARITLIPFAEDSPVGISEVLARELSTLLSADGVTMAPDPRHADGVLSGAILSASSRSYPVAPGSGIQVPAYQMSVRIRAELKDASGEKLWTSHITLTEDFLASGATGSESALTTEANRRSALHRLAQQAARQLHSQLMLAAATDPVVASDESP